MDILRSEFVEGLLLLDFDDLTITGIPWSKSAIELPFGSFKLLENLFEREEVRLDLTSETDSSDDSSSGLLLLELEFLLSVPRLRADLRGMFEIDSSSDFSTDLTFFALLLSLLRLDLRGVEFISL